MMKKSKRACEALTFALARKNVKDNVTVHNQTEAEEMFVIKPEEAEAILYKTTYMPRSHQPKKEKKKAKPNGVSMTPSPGLYCHLSDDGSKASNWAPDTSAIQKMQGKQMFQTALEADECRNACIALQNEEKIMLMEVDGILDQEDFRHQRVQEMMHNEWTMRVYDPLKRKAYKAACGPKFESRRWELQDLYRAYLKHLNKEGHLFMNVMDKDLAYAKALAAERPAQITLRLPDIRDPLILQRRHRNQEDQDIVRCLTGETIPWPDIDRLKLPPLNVERHNSNIQQPRPAWNYSTKIKEPKPIKSILNTTE